MKLAQSDKDIIPVHSFRVQLVPVARNFESAVTQAKKTADWREKMNLYNIPNMKKIEDYSILTRTSRLTWRLVEWIVYGSSQSSQDNVIAIKKFSIPLNRLESYETV